MDEPWTNPVSLHAGIPSEPLGPWSTMGHNVNVWLWITINKFEKGALATTGWEMKVCWNKAGQCCHAQMVQENENKSKQMPSTKDAKGGLFSSLIHPCMLTICPGKLGITLSLLWEQGLWPVAPCPEARSSLGESVALSLGASGFMMLFPSLWGPAGNSAKTAWACWPFSLPRWRREVRS